MGSSSSIPKLTDVQSVTANFARPFALSSPVRRNPEGRSLSIGGIGDTANVDRSRHSSNTFKMARPRLNQLLLSALCGNRFVKYIPEIMGHRELNNVKVWWFPEDFCQSRLGDRVIGSNACTLIDILLAHRIQYYKITIRGDLEEPLTHNLISALAESIIDGNEIYETLQKMGELQYPHLTLPEALKYYHWVKDELQMQDPNLNTQPTVAIKELCNFVEMNTTIREKLFDTCHRGIMEWELNHEASLSATSNLFMVLIAAERSMLMVYQRHRRQVTLIDSHSHQNHGAVVSQTNILNLDELCHWYDNMCKTWFGCNPTAFEVSFLHYQ